MALQTNDFFGKDGTAKWWIGQVPLGQEINKVNATKWGDRVQAVSYTHLTLPTILLV